MDPQSEKCTVDYEREMSLFEFSNYRDYIRYRLNQKREIRGYHSRIARAAGCQKSFLTQVLKEQLNLSRDHAAALTEFFKFSEQEANYFLALVDFERAGTTSLRRMELQRIERLRKNADNLLFNRK